VTDFLNICAYSQTLANAQQNWLARHAQTLSQAEASLLLDSYTHLALLAGGMRGYLSRQTKAMELLGELEKIALSKEGTGPRNPERAQMSRLIDDIRRELVVVPSNNVPSSLES
jgi:hypothetical protein